MPRDGEEGQLIDLLLAQKGLIHLQFSVYRFIVALWQENQAARLAIVRTDD